MSKSDSLELETSHTLLCCKLVVRDHSLGLHPGVSLGKFIIWPSAVFSLKQKFWIFLWFIIGSFDGNGELI